MRFEYALEVFLVMSLYNDLVLVLFWCNENKEKFSGWLSTLSSWFSKLVGWLQKCEAKSNNNNNDDRKGVKKDDPKDVKKGVPKTVKKYDMISNMVRPRAKMNQSF